MKSAAQSHQPLEPKLGHYYSGSVNNSVNKTAHGECAGLKYEGWREQHNRKPIVVNHGTVDTTACI